MCDKSGARRMLLRIQLLRSHVIEMRKWWLRKKPGLTLSYSVPRLRRAAFRKSLRAWNSWALFAGMEFQSWLWVVSWRRMLGFVRKPAPKELREFVCSRKAIWERIWRNCAASKSISRRTSECAFFQPADAYV